MKELSEMSLEELWKLFPVKLTEYNDEWNKWYDDEQENLRKILADIDVTRISHIGSTAIKAIWAKPTVDILVEIRNRPDFASVKSLLLDNGYSCMSESDTRMSFNKGYTKYGFAERVFHIHIRLSGDNDELYFRDYMNDHYHLAKEYEKIKLSLWKQYENDRDAYTDGKAEFVEFYTRQAKKAYGDRYK
ncbi:MAG: GrpB family protein [Clostridiales bacterium]|jgi:GrpB-like predicted nucleotidyltransferase (UPF0157 family)|nr:GrpB family protein [Clostridiales bacterium]